VNQLKLQINDAAFHKADSINNSSGWNHFINTYTSSPTIKRSDGKEKHDKFIEALRKTDYSSFEEFLKQNPDDLTSKQCKSLYEKYVYKTKQQTVPGKRSRVS